MDPAESVDHESDALNRLFDSAVVTFYIAGHGDAFGEIVEQIKVHRLGGRLVIIGKTADDGCDDQPTANRTVGIPWDCVKIFYVMSREYFERHVKGRGVSTAENNIRLQSSTLLSD